MKKNNAVSHSVSGLFVFVLLGVFALMATVTVLLGVNAYRGTARRSDVHNSARITSAYLRSMLRAEDKQDAVRLETVDGIETVTLCSTYGDESYVTRMYVYDGMLREWFAEADMEFEPENGEEVCPAQEMQCAVEDNIMVLRVKNDENWNEIRCALYAAAQ